MIDLAELIVENFQMDPDIAKIVVEQGVIYIDDEIYGGDPHSIPEDLAANKDIVVKGIRNVRVHVVG